MDWGRLAGAYNPQGPVAVSGILGSRTIYRDPGCGLAVLFGDDLTGSGIISILMVQNMREKKPYARFYKTPLLLSRV